MESDRAVAPPVVGVMVVDSVGSWFAETLDAVAAQDYPNLRWVMLIHSDGSPDDEAEFERLESWILEVIPDAFVRRSGATDGFGPTANEILDLVQGDNGLFLICHDDIAPDPDTVRVLVEELYRSNAGLVGPKLLDWVQPQRLVGLGAEMDRFGELVAVVEEGEIDQGQHDTVSDVFVVPSACMLVRADLFRALGGFDPALDFHGEDRELCWRAHLSGARIVVVSTTGVRHRGLLEQRREDLNHSMIAERHRIRAVMTLTAARRLGGRLLQLSLLTVVEMFVGLLTGRFAEAVASARALLGATVRSAGIITRRRRISGGRLVPDQQVSSRLLGGSARLRGYLRGRESATYIGADSSVRRWQPATYGPLLAWFVVIALVIIGSRSFIDRGVPEVGEFLRYPESPRDLLRSYLTGWDPRGGGITAAVPTGWLSIVLLSVGTGFRMALAMTVSVIAMVLIGAIGMWRLAAVFPLARTRIVAMVVYVGTPLVPGVMATGRWSALAWYAALPWLVYALRCLAGLGTADPALASRDLVEAVAEPSGRERLRWFAMLSLVLALTAAFVPVVVVLWLLVGLVLVMTTLMAGGSVQTAGWFSIGTVGAAVVAAILNLPWSTSWDWTSMVPATPAGPEARGLVAVLGLSVDGRSFVVLALGLYLATGASLAVTRAWRLTWSVRAAGLVLIFGAAAVFADRGDLPVRPPDVALLMVPMVLGLAIAAGSLAGGFGEDVLGSDFGWRQPVALLANVAIVVALVPALVAVGNGAWNAPRGSLSNVLAAQLPADPLEGDYRTLFIGDPRVLPVPSREYRDGVSYALVDDDRLDFTDRWAAPVTGVDDRIRAVLDEMAAGSTLRAGRQLAPLGVRYVVVPEIDGVGSTTARPRPIPGGLAERLNAQLDLARTFGAPNVNVYLNRSWVPTTALITGQAADAVLADSGDPGDPGQTRLSGSETVFAGFGADLVVTDEIEPGVVYFATAFDDRWWLRIDGDRITPERGFALTTAFDVRDLSGPAAASLGYDRPVTRTIWVVLQVLLWAVVLLAASSLRAVLPRRVGAARGDAALIDLGEASGDAGWLVDPELDPDVDPWAHSSATPPPPAPSPTPTPTPPPPPPPARRPPVVPPQSDPGARDDRGGI